MEFVQWEYMIRKTTEISLPELNDIGIMGWELCAMDYDTDTSTDIYIFKRKR